MVTQGWAKFKKESPELEFHTAVADCLDMEDMINAINEEMSYLNQEKELKDQRDHIRAQRAAQAA
eukprot:7842392-Pyramimonas_sp.AAC.1